MILIIGGAYQGKLDYALERFPGKQVFQCEEENAGLDTSRDIINSLHLMLLAQTRAGLDSLEFLREKLPLLKDKIVICDDISCGVVPLDSQTREWRETTGRALALLSRHAAEVIRVFCGIGSRLK